MGASDSSLFGNSSELLDGGGCCDYRDHPTLEKNNMKGQTREPNGPIPLSSKPLGTGTHSDEELEILVRERIRQNSKRDQTRLAFTDPSIDPSSSVLANQPASPPFETITPSMPLFGSFQSNSVGSYHSTSARNWKVTVAISSAANLPKTDLLGNLSDIACCASVFKTDVANHVISLGKVVHEVDGMNILSSQRNSAFNIRPQFRSKRKENLVPRDLISPCWDETFTATECHTDLEYAGSMWRTRRPKDNNGSGPCLLLVSIHDTQTHDGNNGVIGEVWVPLLPGAGVVDSWYPLLKPDGETVKGHGGGDASINLRTSFSAST